MKYLALGELVLNKKIFTTILVFLLKFLHKNFSIKNCDTQETLYFCLKHTYTTLNHHGTYRAFCRLNFYYHPDQSVSLLFRARNLFTHGNDSNGK